MAQGSNDYKTVTTYLKLLLKEQKQTYRSLADGIGLSESGVKKILGADDGSFRRVSQICDYLGVSLADILKGSSEEELQVRFSSKQQDLLLRDSKAFALYWRLVYERMPLEAAQAKMHLSQKETFSILKKLDEAKLLKLMPGDRVHIPPIQLVRWTGTGPLIEKLYREWSLNLVRDVASPRASPDNFFQIRYFKVKPKTFADLMTALRDLENEFTRRATQDMRGGNEDLVHLRWLTAADRRSFLD